MIQWFQFISLFVSLVLNQSNPGPAPRSTIEEGGKEEDLADALVPILADLLSDEGAGKVVKDTNE